MSLFDQNLKIFKAIKPTYTRKRLGLLGRYNDDGSIDPDVRSGLSTDNNWVRFADNRGATRVKNLKVRAEWGTPVWVEYNELTREDEVREVHAVLAPQTFGGALAAALNTPHIPASVSTPIRAGDLIPGGVFADEGGGLVVRVMPTWSPGGAWWDGLTLITLTPTATANRKSFCVVGIHPLTNAHTTALTADRGLAAALISEGVPTTAGAADIKAIIDANPTIFWVGAVELAHGTTAIDPARIVDVRLWNLPTLAGANGTSAGSKGFAPKPAATDHTKFLRGDATWADINGSINWAVPGTIGSTTPNTGAFSSLSATGGVVFGTAGSLSGRVIVTPGASERGIDMQLNATPGDIVRVRTSGGNTVFSITSIGRASYRMISDDNDAFSVKSAGGTSIFQMGTLSSSNLFSMTGLSGQSGDFMRVQDNSSNILAQVRFDGRTKFATRHAGTASIVAGLTLGDNSSNTPAAGFGSQIALELESSTTENTAVGSIDWLWNVATHASRVPDLVFKLTDASATRELLRMRANGSAGAIGFFGATPVARQTGYTTFANLTTDRTLDANSTSLDELADVVGTLIEDLKALGLIGE